MLALWQLNKKEEIKAVYEHVFYSYFSSGSVVNEGWNNEGEGKEVLGKVMWVKS